MAANKLMLHFSIQRCPDLCHCYHRRPHARAPQESLSQCRLHDVHAVMNSTQFPRPSSIGLNELFCAKSHVAHFRPDTPSTTPPPKFHHFFPHHYQDIHHSTRVLHLRMTCPKCFFRTYCQSHSQFFADICHHFRCSNKRCYKVVQTPQDFEFSSLPVPCHVPYEDDRRLWCALSNPRLIRTLFEHTVPRRAFTQLPLHQVYLCLSLCKSQAALRHIIGAKRSPLFHCVSVRKRRGSKFVRFHQLDIDPKPKSHCATLCATRPRNTTNEKVPRAYPPNCESPPRVPVTFVGTHAHTEKTLNIHKTQPYPHPGQTLEVTIQMSTQLARGGHTSGDQNQWWVQSNLRFMLSSLGWPVAFACISCFG